MAGQVGVSLMLFAMYLPIYLGGLVLSYPLVPVAVIFSNKDGRLSWIFRWLETHDNLGWTGPASEPSTAKTTAIFGPRAGLVHWLWRNKAYTLRYWLRARVTGEMPRSEAGVVTPKRWGFSYWRGRVGPYWEYQPRIGFGKFHLYLRIGWKMRPYFVNSPLLLSAGIFTGISIRSDDWDDYETAPQPVAGAR